MKKFIVRIVAGIVHSETKRWKKNPVRTQEKILSKLIRKGKKTDFGKDHHFGEIKCYEDFKQHVPIREYEQFRSYIDKIKNGASDVLWPGKPSYLCKTSGTTSGSKYIPLTKDALPNHLNSARNVMLNYIHETGRMDFINGKMIFIQGSPVLDSTNGIPTGRLSGIVAHHIPGYLKKNRMPSMSTNSISDWEQKIDTIADETVHENMTLISGIPPWLLMYFKKLIEKSGRKQIKDIFPNFNLLITGGVNFAPYKNLFDQLIGKPVDTLEVYPASEGFFAYQDNLEQDGLLLLLKEGIFYEFIEVKDVHKKNPNRCSIKDVKTNVNYALVISSNAGLWGYLIGDTVKFTSLNPHKIVITGRIGHFTSAFGEHLITEEVESALSEIISEVNAEIVEFTVAPQVNPSEDELPYHEWFIEFKVKPNDLPVFAQKLDKKVGSRNPYYKDLIEGKVLQTLKIRPVVHDGFQSFMKKEGKLGGQNKIIHLSNDRKIADKLIEFTTYF